jgi:HSP20 family protein
MAAPQTQTATPSTSQDTRPNVPDQTNPDNQMSRSAGRQNTGMAHRDAFSFITPFSLFQRLLSDDLSDWLQAIGGRRQRSDRRPMAAADMLAWAPQVDVTRRDDQIVVRADLPGVAPEDLVVEVTDDAITISGERQQERVDENGSVYRFERAYGAFFRQIPLPSGARSDQAKATFTNGVLEITVPAPPDQASRGRRLEVASGETKGETTKKEGKEGGATGEA